MSSEEKLIDDLPGGTIIQVPDMEGVFIMTKQNWMESRDFFDITNGETHNRFKGNIVYVVSPGTVFEITQQ